MALTVKDVLDLPSGQKMQLVAGSRGLGRPVISVEIADYEFATDVQFSPSADFDLERDMEPGSFIITSFLFAKDDPGLILSSVQTLQEMGMSGLAFKQIIYDELPEEVIRYADETDFPLLAFNKNVWFENIIFDIMYAVQFDDKVYLSEEKIDAMLAGTMNRSELDIIIKGISLKLRQFVSAAYISGDGLDAGRILRSFYLMKGLHGKCLMVRYNNDMFMVITSQRDDPESHALILSEALDALGISGNILTGMSDVHESKKLDAAFRESRYCFIASRAEGKIFSSYRRTGIYRFLLPAVENSETKAFAKDLLDAIAGKPDLRETVDVYVASGGDIAKAAATLHCHQNTVRYRLSRVRELTGLEDLSDSELFMQLKMAVIIERTTAMIVTSS